VKRHEDRIAQLLCFHESVADDPTYTDDWVDVRLSKAEESTISEERKARVERVKEKQIEKNEKRGESGSEQGTSGEREPSQKRARIEKREEVDDHAEEQDEEDQLLVFETKPRLNGWHAS
jgi:uncharacterized protein YdaU (DUF1376 family)